MDEHVTTRAQPSSLDRLSPVPEAPAPLVRRRRGVRWPFVLLLLLAAGAVVWRYMPQQPQPAGGTRPAAGQATPPQSVGAAAAAPGDIRVILNALGTVTPLANVTVKTQIAGQLQSLGFSEGQMVHKGDFLAQIDPRPYEAALSQYDGQLARDQSLLKQAQTNLGRYNTLLKQDSIARQQADDQAFLVQQYIAAIRTDEAQVAAQKLNIEYCRIIAPVTGRVGLRQVDVGNYVQVSDTGGLVVITQLQPISVIFPLPEDDLPRVLPALHAGEKLQVEAYDRANVTRLATGVLSTTDNQVDTTTGTWKLRADFANDDEALFPNQFVNIRLLLKTLHDVTVVPVAAVLRGAPGTYVYLIGADDKVSVRPVKLGTADGDKVQIIEGLQPGDRVVVDGTDRLREGARVRVQAEGPPGTPPAQHAQGKHAAPATPTPASGTAP